MLTPPLLCLLWEEREKRKKKLDLITRRVRKYFCIKERMKKILIIVRQEKVKEQSSERKLMI